MFSILNRKEQNLLQNFIVLGLLYFLVPDKNDINGYIWKKNAIMSLQAKPIIAVILVPQVHQMLPTI